MAGSSSGALLGGQHIDESGNRLAIVWRDGHDVVDYLDALGLHDLDDWVLGAGEKQK
jgi:hypothetical protein